MDFESDCAVLIIILASNSFDCSEIGRVVEDCKEYMTTIYSISFQQICREANDVANCLAHLINRSYIDDCWLEETLSIIEDVLYEDICKCNRGLSAMFPSLCGLIIVNK